MSHLLPLPPSRRSTQKTYCASLKGPNRGHTEGLKEPNYHQSPPSTLEPESLNSMMPDIESLCGMHNALQV